MSSASPRVALAGCAALAIAIGVGRFAFTPLFPLMQDGAGLTTGEGAWLASANYAGYLAGALTATATAMRSTPAAAIRTGLILIACSTLAMGFSHTFAGWLALRTLAGVASAWVLVFASAWALEKMAGASNALSRGVVFSGVGIGIAASGLLVMGIMRMGTDAAHGWALLGLASLALCGLVWRAFGTHSEAPRSASPQPRTPTPMPMRLILAYGAFGFGYIIPATFLPVMAREVLGAGASFEWAWPVFGLAAAVSTLVSAALSTRVSTQRLWIAGHVLMAAGMLMPVVHTGLASIVSAAGLVGCTFMVITVAGLQRAREVAGGHAAPLIAAMTSAFAVGQILGPLAAALVLGRDGGFSIALAAAAATLLLAACALVKPEKERHEALSQPRLAVRAPGDGRRA